VNFSIIIPTKNSAATLSACLQAARNLNLIEDAELIVVDAGSSDTTVEIAKQFTSSVYSLPAAHQKGSARNRGAEAAQGDLLIFIDSDILVPNTLLNRISDDFSARPEIDAVNGLLAKEHPNSNFISQYKNLYMFYRFAGLPDSIDFFFTSITAIRKESFVPFPDDIKPKDTEMGQLFSKKYQRKIYFNRELQVVHLKKYSLLSMLKNDFSIAFGWSRSFLRLGGVRDVLTKGRFAHASNGQLGGLCVSGLLLLSPIAYFFTTPKAVLLGQLLLVAVFGLIHLKFFSFLAQERGLLFCMRSMLLTWIDELALLAGALAGTLRFLSVKVSSEKSSTPSYKRTCRSTVESKQ